MAETATTEAWHALPTERVSELLKTSADGVLAADVDRRRQSYGTNALPPPVLPGHWRVLLAQFQSPLIVILLVAAVVSFWLRETRDATVILAVVVINAIIGYRQEYQSDRAVQKLLQLTQPIVHVIRDGQEHECSVDDLVVGDLVLVASGDVIPADGRWLTTVHVRVNEASLTGEAAPRDKFPEPVSVGTALPERSSMGWRGTTVASGRGMLIVTAVGRQTQFGQIISSIEQINQAGTPFQKQLAVFSRKLIYVTLGLGALVLLMGMWRQLPFESIFLLSVSLIVSIIPEGLPVVITLAMAWGMWAMAKRQAVVRKLSSVETLGSVTVVATDKTGTLTYGEMMMEQLWVGNEQYVCTGRGYEPDGAILRASDQVSSRSEPAVQLALQYLMLNNDSRFIYSPTQERLPAGDPTELALIVAGEKAGLNLQELHERFPRLGEVPFDARLKYMLTWHRHDEGRVAILKGAPLVVLDHCQSLWGAGGDQPMTEHHRRMIRAMNQDWSSRGLRGLAVAIDRRPDDQPIENDHQLEVRYTFVGLVGIADAVRPEAAAAIAGMHRAGVRTIMLTGDATETGKRIAMNVGLLTDDATSAVLAGDELDRLTDDELQARIGEVRVATRLTPEGKVRIAAALKRRGDIVAMTGDGMNDAPALREADVGIAVGRTSSDAAKEAADIVLTDGNYASIVAAIAEGRRIFRNIRRIVYYLLASNFSELGLIVGALLLGMPLPLLPTQIIWLNAVTDPLLGIALAKEPVSPLAMSAEPLPPQTPLVTPPMWRRILVLALVLTGTSLAVFAIGLARDLPRQHLYAVTLTTLAFGEWFIGLAARSSLRSIFKVGFTNQTILIALAVIVLMQLAILYFPPLAASLEVVPLTLLDWALVALGSIPVLMVEEILKWRRRQHIATPRFA
ncbi:MAG: cation-transporting P-type ATPase [Candidatus Kerfeldbacteria bacterium]|nr:cation-transporting P-type ATPase [Candidatus Kerfeldbacteria bacterium]